MATWEKTGGKRPKLFSPSYLWRFKKRRHGGGACILSLSLSLSAASSGLVGLLTYFGTVSRRVARSLIRSYGRKGGGTTGDLEEQPTGSMYTCPVGSCHQPPLTDSLALPFSPSPASQPTPTHFCGHVLAHKQPSQTFLATPLTFSFRAFLWHQVLPIAFPLSICCNQIWIFFLNCLCNASTNSLFWNGISNYINKKCIIKCFENLWNVELSLKKFNYLNVKFNNI